MEKKASLHVEIILAFVLFIGFVIFLLAYLQPYKSNVIQTSLMSNLEISFFNETATDLTIVFINSTTLCTPSTFLSKNNFVVPINAQFFYLYVSHEFIDQQSPCGAGNYTLGSITEEKLLSQKALETFQDTYTHSYSSLKEKLLIPPNIDFSVVSSDNEFVSQRNIPDQVEVLAKNSNLRVLYENGTILNKDFIFKIW